jgi:hypothetical protein
MEIIVKVEFWGVIISQTSDGFGGGPMPLLFCCCFFVCG